MRSLMGRSLMASVAALFVVAGMATGALAQEGYPPDDPPPGVTAEVEIEVRCDEVRAVATVGEGFLTDSTVTVEVHATGSAPVASDSTTVDQDGAFALDVELPSDYTRDSVRVRVTGRDANDRPVTFTEVLDDVPPPGCADVLGTSGEGDDDVSGGLAFTGVNLLILLLIAAVLLGLGAFLVRRRRSQQADVTA